MSGLACGNSLLTLMYFLLSEKACCLLSLKPCQFLRNRSIRAWLITCWFERNNITLFFSNKITYRSNQFVFTNTFPAISVCANDKVGVEELHGSSFV